MSSTSTNSTPSRGSIARSERFLGTIKQELQESGHVSIVDETSDRELESPIPAPRPKIGRGHSARAPSGRRSRSPKRSQSTDGLAPRRSRSPMADRSGTSVTGGSGRHLATSTRSFVSRAGPILDSRGGTDDHDELRDFDDDDDFNVRPSSSIHSASSASGRGSGSGSTPNRRSFWKNKSRQGVVDQRVNLMDAETGQYERQASNRRGMGIGFRQKSLVDIFLHDDFGASDHNSRRSHMGETSVNKGNSGGMTKWIILAFLLCLAVAAILTIPGLGIVGGGNNTPTATEPPTTNPPTTTPPPTPTPTAPPTEEIKLLPEDQTSQEPNVDAEPEAGPSLVAPQEPPVSATSPTPQAQDMGDGLSLDTQAIPTDSRQEALQFLVTDQDVSESASFQDPNSASSKALQWITEEDTARLPIPGVDKVDDAVLAERQLVQRYAMAVFYFSQQVESSTGDEQGARRRIKEATQEELDNRQQFDRLWTSGTSVCEWPGVTCDSNQLVNGIDMSDSLLGGTLPREIMTGSAFPFMTTLDVSHNQLEGTLPRLYESNAVTGRSMLPSENALEFLFLQHNTIQGNIDPIVALEQLTYVDLSNNEFTGYIPAEFGAKLKQLDTFHLAMNNLQGTLPADMASMTQLARLDMEGNLFTGTIPSEWSGLTGLEVLTLSHCDTIEGTIPEALAQMKGMKYLSLQKTNLKGTIPSFLGDLSQLRELYLHNTELTGTMPEKICSLTESNLEALTSDCSADLGSVECKCCTDCFWRR